MLSFACSAHRTLYKARCQLCTVQQATYRMQCATCTSTFYCVSSFAFCARMLHAEVMRHACCMPAMVLLVPIARRILHATSLSLHFASAVLQSDRATVLRAPLQGFNGGVLRITNGDATFESVAISDPTAQVSMAQEADRVGGGLVC
jgi:hypothetical protein